MSALEVLANALAVQFPADAARVLDAHAPADVAAFLSELDVEVGAAVLGALSPSVAAEVVVAMEVATAARLLESLRPGDAAHLLRRLGDSAAPVLAAMNRDSATALRRLASYPPNTAGALMETSVAVMAAEVDAATALAAFRTYGNRLQHYLYVTDRERRLAGVVRPVELALAEPGDALIALATKKVARLRDSDDLVTIATHDGWNHWRSLPVVDRQGMFLGAVQHRAIRRLLAAKAGAQPTGRFSLPMSLAELFWLGLAGFTEGLARVATPPEDRDGR